MWFLIGQENVEQIACWISLDKPVTIGRKGCTLVVSNDQSISRHHITLWAVRNNEVGALTPSSVYIRDEKARYGTYVNKQIVQEGEQRLNDKDEIQLGSQTSRFRICYRPVNICYSKVPSGTQKQLTQLARSMDITTTNQWHNECTHLLMEELCVTDKVVLALIHGIPIVTSGWLRALASAHDMLIEQGEKSLPDPNLFLPRITDPSIPSHISFRANPRRRNLFANRVFITFSEEQYVRVDRAISAAGGKAVYCRIGEQVAPTAIAIAEYCRAWTSVCILEPCQIDLLEVVRRAASRLDRPLTPECDIGLAVMYGSTSIYCSDDSMTSSTLSSEHNTETNSLASSTSQLTEKGITETKKCVQPTLNEAFKFARARTGSELSSKFNSLLENMMSSESATESSISSSLAKIPAMNDVILSTMEESDISVRNTSASVIEQERSSKLTSKAVVDSMPYR
ncbi:hypothetical protein BDF22DRAFT_99484 [Syncephalis plumigaleata]|nr:hypothetical protein BDF22DRAFT_99484 [Syncephalis plumigaleata]